GGGLDKQRAEAGPAAGAGSQWGGGEGVVERVAEAAGRGARTATPPHGGRAERRDPRRGRGGALPPARRKELGGEGSDLPPARRRGDVYRPLRDDPGDGQSQARVRPDHARPLGRGAAISAPRPAAAAGGVPNRPP